ncbi:hypothetical protein [Rhodococcus artemisiae]|uniref:WXG100 family type VII secretion target n=1 Tax=Rhodococcus artemisiae TaxID=714159 RepID=A0ABU7LKL0_9NOCA|nr:hypothetical protein [Rhodococcus artemisiae]MEE2062101.1 hypothetical protein [Rhodococcus artemisiae]
MSSRVGLVELLDAGAPGLDFFAAYLPRAHRVGIAGRVTVDGLRARYDEQIGLDVSVLADDAAVLTRLVADLEGRVEEQTDGVHALRSAWRGDAGDLARDDLDRAVQRGAMLYEAVHALARACTGAVDGITRAVNEKSSAVGLFADMSVDGRTPEDIDAIIAGARGGTEGPTAEQVALWCAEAGTPAARPDGVAAWCTQWLHEVFAPTITARIDRFIEVCGIADATVDDHLAAVVRAFDLLDASTSAPESAQQLGGGSRGTTDTAGGQDDVLRATADLVDAGRDLVEAVADLTGAVADLATTAVEGATAFTEAVTSGIFRPSVEEVAPRSVPESPVPEAPTGFVPDSREPAPAPAPRPAATPSEPDASVTLPSEPDASVTLPSESSSSEDTGPPSGPVVAQAPAGGRAVNRRSGANSGAAITDPGDAGRPRDDGDGVVLAEAGPL